MGDRTCAVIRQRLRSVDVNALDSQSPWVKLARARAQEVFGADVRPCLWQVKVALATLKGGKHVLSVSRTGSGKTLTFWIPVILTDDGILIVVVPLNLLGKQNIDQLTIAGIKSILITGDTATAQNFNEIQTGNVRVIVTNPELLMRPGDSGFAKLFQDPGFSSRIIALVIDEGHCVTQWGSFRPDYKEMCRLQSVLPGSTFHITSATLPSYVLNDVLGILQINRDQLFIIRRSNDRPNVAITVKEIQHSLTSFADLDFLVDGWVATGTPPPKFLVLFDDKGDTVKAARRLRLRLPASERDKIKWHNADMSSDYRVKELEALKIGNTIGICATDTLGMGMDIPDFLIVIQWRAVRLSMCTLMQRLGRAARSPLLQATFILFVESKYLDYNKKVMPPREESNGPSEQHPCNPSQSRNGSGPISSSRASEMVSNSSRTLDPGLPVVRSLDEVKEARRAVYAEFFRTSQLSQPRDFGKSRHTELLEPAIEDLINAEERGLECRRTPAEISFDNGNLDCDHLLCDDSSPTGCPRCSPQSADPCCDLCNPGAFDDLLFSSPPPPPPPSKPNKSALKKYEREGRDMEVALALNAWRQKKTIELHGQAMLRDVGSALVLNDSILDRIVNCVHFGKIRTVEDLRREVEWSLTDELGPDVLAIIDEVSPPVPVPRRPRKPRNTDKRRPLATNSRLLNTSQYSAPPTPASAFLQNPLLLPSTYDSILHHTQNTAASCVAAGPLCDPPLPTRQNPAPKRKRCGVCGEEGHNKRRHNGNAIGLHTPSGS